MDRQWEEDVQIISKRLVTLYYYMVNSMLEDLPEEETEKIIKRAIKNYGMYWGNYCKEKVKECGLPVTARNYCIGKDLPSRGLSKTVDLVDDENELLQSTTNCLFGEMWKDMDFSRWGRLYCAVDFAKFEAYDPELKSEHQKHIMDGDECCLLHVCKKQ